MTVFIVGGWITWFSGEQEGELVFVKKSTAINCQWGGNIDIFTEPSEGSENLIMTHSKSSSSHPPSIPYHPPSPPPIRPQVITTGLLSRSVKVSKFSHWISYCNLIKSSQSKQDDIYKSQSRKISNLVSRSYRLVLVRGRSGYKTWKYHWLWSKLCEAWNTRVAINLVWL